MFQGSSNCGAPDQHSNATTDMPFRWSVSGPGGMAAAQNTLSPHLPPENTMFSMSLDHGMTQRHGNPSLDTSFDSMPSLLTSEESSLFRNDFNFSKMLNEPLPQGVRGHESTGQCLLFMQHAQGHSMLLAFSDTHQDRSFGCITLNLTLRNMPYLPSNVHSPAMPSPATSLNSLLAYSELNTSSVGLSMHNRYTTHQQIESMLHGTHEHYDFPSQAAGIPSSSGLSPMQLLAEEIKKINVKLSELQIANERLTLCMEDGEVAINGL
ncbi:hypothetical protein J3A83DRAFT_4184989 [Scleroderma citrinum]